MTAGFRIVRDWRSEDGTESRLAEMINEELTAARIRSEMREAERWAYATGHWLPGTRRLTADELVRLERRIRIELRPGDKLRPDR